MDLKFVKLRRLERITGSEEIDKIFQGSKFIPRCNHDNSLCKIDGLRLINEVNYFSFDYFKKA